MNINVREATFKGSEIIGSLVVELTNELSELTNPEHFDIDLNSTHMEYLKTSHKRKFGFWDMNLVDKLKDLESKQKNNSYHPNNKFHLTGKKGDVFLFNSLGMHRANFINNSYRSVLHLNFTNGHNLYEYQNKPNENLKSDNSETILRKKENLVYNKGNYHTYFNNKFIFKYFQVH